MVRHGNMSREGVMTVVIEIASDTAGNASTNEMTAARTMTAGIIGLTVIPIPDRGGGVGRGPRLLRAGEMIIVNAIGIANGTIAGRTCILSQRVKLRMTRIRAVSARTICVAAPFGLRARSFQKDS